MLNKLIGIVFILFICVSCDQKKIAIVDNQKLFKEFTMTKELQVEIDTYNETSKQDLDKIRNQVYFLETQLKSDTVDHKDKIEQQLRRLLGIYEERERVYQDSTINMVNKGDLKIWNRIHEYTNVYAKENGIDIILKNRDELDMLYVDESMNITEELIPFLNKKYEGN